MQSDSTQMGRWGGMRAAAARYNLSGLPHLPPIATCSTLGDFEICDDGTPRSAASTQQRGHRCAASAVNNRCYSLKPARPGCRGLTWGDVDA